MNKVYMKEGKLIVPSNVTVPFIKGDRVGAEITPSCQKIVNKAVELAYSAHRIEELHFDGRRIIRHAYKNVLEEEQLKNPNRNATF